MVTNALMQAVEASCAAPSSRSMMVYVVCVDMKVRYFNIGMVRTPDTEGAASKYPSIAGVIWM